MSDEAKLGLVAGVLAVIGVAAFGLPREPTAPPKAEVAISNNVNAPPPPVNVNPAR
jgi:hypothetical protein